jgi:hypothetical protein
MTRKRKVVNENGEDPQPKESKKNPDVQGDSTKEHFPKELVRYLEQMSREEPDPEMGKSLINSTIKLVFS